MPNRPDKTIDAPPSYESATGADTSSHSISPGLDQLVRIIGNHERLHFHAPIGMGYFTVPEVVQIRDSNEQPILCIMAGRMIVSGGQSRVASSREIMTPSGETLISISPGTIQTLYAGDQILGKLEDDKLLCGQTLKARNVIGDVIFEGAGDFSMGKSGCSCCIECGFGCCCPNSTEFIFSHREDILGRLTRSESNSSKNKLELFNWADIDPKTMAILLYASYCAYLMFFVNTKCGRIGDRGTGRICFISLIVGSLILMCLPLWILLR